MTKGAVHVDSYNSVATYARCGGIFDVHLTAKRNLSVKESLKSINMWQERDCLVHFLCLLAVCWPNAEVHETLMFLLVTINRF